MDALKTVMESMKNLNALKKAGHKLEPEMEAQLNEAKTKLKALGLAGDGDEEASQTKKSSLPAPPMNVGLVAMVPLAIAFGFLGKKFWEMQQREEGKNQKKKKRNGPKSK